MKDALLGICFVIVIGIFWLAIFYPYHKLVNLRDIADEMEKISDDLGKIRKAMEEKSTHSNDSNTLGALEKRVTE